MEGFRSIGISYKNAPIEVREQIALAKDEIDLLLIQLRDVLALEECLIISTCNRTEIYYIHKADKNQEVLSLLLQSKGLQKSEVSDYFTFRDTYDSLNHIFRVSCGLESKVLGDIQISNQVKVAYQQSIDSECAGPFIHRLLHTIFFTNKKITQQTRLQDGTASVASVAVGLISGFIQNISNPRIALIGLGEIGQNVLDNLRNLDVDLTLVNRTRSRAEKLAEGREVVIKDFSELGQVVTENDIIILAVSTKNTIIDKSFVLDHLKGRKLLLDLSVPRAIADDVEEIPGVVLYNNDQLSERTHGALEIRETSIVDAEAILQEGLSGFNEWKDEMEVSPTINKLKKALDKIRREELARVNNISEEERQLLEVVTKNMVQKVIKLPVLQLKAACKRGEADTLVGVLHDLFNLEEAENPVKK